MSDKNKNKKRFLKDFILYNNDKMTTGERNAFERKLQKDPFAEEAEEGFSKLSAGTIGRDITILQKRIDNKLKKRQKTNFYRISAAVTILIILSGIVFVSQKKNKELILSENLINKEIESPFSIRMPDPITGPPVTSIEKDDNATPPDIRESKTEEDVLPVDNKDLLISESQMEKKANVTVSDPSESEPEKEIQVTGVAEKKSLSAGVRDEMVRAAAMPAAAKSETPSDYVEAKPVVGLDSFDIYLKKNIRPPVSDTTDQKIVILTFNVQIDSTLSDIKVISSPGPAWSEEATRLIKEGPVWEPAKENGFPKESGANVRIIFN